MTPIGHVTSSSIATSRVANDKKKIYLATDPASSDLTGKLCNAYTVHWTYDTYALAVGTGRAMVQEGGDTCSVERDLLRVDN